MNKFIINLKKTNFYYFYKLVIDNNLKFFFFLIIGLLIGYFLHNNTEKQLIIYKKISPLNKSFHLFGEVIGVDTIFNDFIRIHREKVTEKEYKQIFEINIDSPSIEKPSTIFKKKIPTNLTYNDYLKLSEGHTYLKERIDYEFDIYHISKSITFRPTENDIEKRVNNLKSNFDKYLNINNQILRYKIFQNLHENPAFYKKVLISFNSDLILVDHEYLMKKLYEKNSKEIEKITKLLLTMTYKANNSENKFFYDRESFKNKIETHDIKKEDLEEPIVFTFKGNSKYSFEELRNFAGIELDRIFNNYFALSVNGIDNRNFQTKIIEKSLFFYLIICSVISFSVLISFLLIRDFVRILRQS